MNIGANPHGQSDGGMYGGDSRGLLGEFPIDDGDFGGSSRRPQMRLPEVTYDYDDHSDVDLLELHYSDEENDDDIGDIEDHESIKYIYREESWNQHSYTYCPKPIDFIGAPSSNIFWQYFPTFMQLFEVFWPFNVLRDIVTKTNRYATVLDVHENTKRGPAWTTCLVKELHVFIAIIMYMGMKRQPNMKTYWHKKGSIFHCSTISSLMSRRHFEQITKYLHLTNPAKYVHDKALPGYDKMGQLRWLINEIRGSCQRAWNVGKFGSVDEMMIRYKGTYCPARQYMPQKLQKWGIKVWCLADAISKFVSNFEVYCGKDPTIANEASIPRGQPKLAHNVVLHLLTSNEGRGHVIAMDNFFTSIPLFKDLLDKGIYATRTVRANRVGLPLVLKNTKAFAKSAQDTLEWRMHELRSISAIVWKDKRPVLILSTHMVPLQFPCQFPIACVPCRNGAISESIHMLPIHLEYTTHMRGVDVADQLRASYTCQTRSHKWWHQGFFPS